MNARGVAILVVLLVVLGGGALLYQRDEQQRRPGSVAALGRPLLKDLKAADIAAIRIVGPKATLTLNRKDERWLLAERSDFPADLAKVRELVLKAIELKVGQSEPIGEKDRSRLNLDASGTRVEFNAADGKPLGVMVVGKKYFKREVDNPDKAIADGRFIALPGDAGMVYVVADPLLLASVQSGEWIDRTSFQVEKIKVLEVRYPAGGGWRIERTGDNAGWKLAGLKPGEKLDISRANAASYSLSLLELADVAPASASADTKMSGLDQPTLIDATTFGGASYAIKVGKLQGDSYYVSFSAKGALKPTEQRLADYVLLIPKSKLEDTLKKRDELLDKPAAKKK